MIIGSTGAVMDGRGMILGNTVPGNTVPGNAGQGPGWVVANRERAPRIGTRDPLWLAGRPWAAACYALV